MRHVMGCSGTGLESVTGGGLGQDIMGMNIMENTKHSQLPLLYFSPSIIITMTHSFTSLPLLPFSSSVQCTAQLPLPVTEPLMCDRQ